jgi:hypothetical protein
MNSDWHPKIYHMTEEKHKIPQAWRAVRGAILRRDHFKCYRCEDGNRRNLTVHHIIPREEGGNEEHENLITLCKACHDLVEEAGCRSLLDIQGTIDVHTKQEPEPTASEERQESFVRPAWHRWVYGSQRGSRQGTNHE